VHDVTIKNSDYVMNEYLVKTSDVRLNLTRVTTHCLRNHTQKLAAVVDGGYTYTSTDSGVTWTERNSSGARDWQSIVSSSDGTVRDLMHGIMQGARHHGCKC